MTGEPFQDEEFRDTFGEGDELNAAFADENAPEEAPEAPAEEPEAPEEAPEEPVKKGRPRRKKGYGLLGIPHILATFVWLAIAIAIGVSLGRVIWVCVSDVMAFGRSDTEPGIPGDGQRHRGECRPEAQGQRTHPLSGAFQDVRRSDSCRE